MVERVVSSEGRPGRAQLSNSSHWVAVQKISSALSSQIALT